MKGSNKVSHSYINAYLKCPKLFYFRHILKLRPPKKPLPLAFGSALHKGLEEYEAKGADPIEEFQKAFKFKEILFEFKGQELEESEALDRYEEEIDNGIRLLEYFLEERENGSLQDYEVLHTEKRFKTPIKSIGKKRCKADLLSGVVDVIRTDEKLVDYKTSSKKYNQKKVDESLQPTFYYLWYYLTYGKLPKGFIYIVFMKKRKSNPIDVLETHRTMKDLKELVDIINQVQTKVERGFFNRNHGRHAFCDCFKLEAYFNSLKEISYDRSNRKRKVVFTL